MQHSVCAYVKKCHKRQVNKQRRYKYGKLPPKLALTTPWKALCVDLTGAYTLKGKDSTVVDFMCITMIDPASCWFEIVELPVTELTQSAIPPWVKRARRVKAHMIHR